MGGNKNTCFQLLTVMRLFFLLKRISMSAKEDETSDLGSFKPVDQGKAR